MMKSAVPSALSVVKKMSARAHTLVTALLLSSACANAPAALLPSDEAELLHTAMQQLTDVIVYDIFSPPQASRAYAYASVAAYEALRPGYPAYRTLAGQLNGLTPPRQRARVHDRGADADLLAGPHGLSAYGDGRAVPAHGHSGARVRQLR